MNIGIICQFKLLSAALSRMSAMAFYESASSFGNWRPDAEWLLPEVQPTPDVAIWSITPLISL
jgi:hypothetical protein